MLREGFLPYYWLTVSGLAVGVSRQSINEVLREQPECQPGKSSAAGRPRGVAWIERLLPPADSLRRRFTPRHYGSAWRYTYIIHMRIINRVLT